MCTGDLQAQIPGPATTLPFVDQDLSSLLLFGQPNGFGVVPVSCMLFRGLESSFDQGPDLV